MQPDQTRRPYPAFRAWVVRLGVYLAVAVAVALTALAVLRRMLPDGLPEPLAWLAMLAAGWVLGGLAGHIGWTLLHDRREAAWRELDQEFRRADGR